ncbi:MAG: formylmethanofuran dehydrogenase subunit E [Cellvibrionaceae bacterium]|jgi:formylmethanofuran dehydrogenase subunit E
MEKFEHITVSPAEVAMRPELQPLLEKAAEMHHHLCPRQVLGVRIGLAGLNALGFQVPIRQKKMLVMVETDGCFVSGVQAATGCSVNRRTLRIFDIGRIGVTFINVKTEQAVRIAPALDVREKVGSYYDEQPGTRRERYLAMLNSYQIMPDEALLKIESVKLTRPVREILSRPFIRVDCSMCGEEVINEREILIDGRPVCQACAGNGYYLATV